MFLPVPGDEENKHKANCSLMDQNMAVEALYALEVVTEMLQVTQFKFSRLFIESVFIPINKNQFFVTDAFPFIILLKFLSLLHAF